MVWIRSVPVEPPGVVPRRSIGLSDPRGTKTSSMLVSELANECAGDEVEGGSAELEVCDASGVVVGTGVDGGTSCSVVC